MIPKLKKIFPKEFEINKLQSNFEEVLNALSASPFVNGRFITTIIGTSDTVIDHKLEREYLGWVVTDIDTNSFIRRSTTVNNNKNRQIILIATVQTNATIYIF